MQKLVFFFPWPEVSGGPFYLCRLADAVARTGLYEVYYTDYSGGLCDSILTEKSIKILKYHDEDGERFSIFPEETVILVMAEYWAHMVPHINPASKIVFFNWHNECIPVLQSNWYATDRFIKKFLGLVEETSSVFFCDKTHYLAHNTYGVSFAEMYVPIVIPPRPQIATDKLVQDKIRNIAILGRLCLDKIYAVLDLMDNIIALRDFVKTNVYIIGEGDCEALLFNRRFPPNIRIIRCGTMGIGKVIDILSKKVDILFAMGTSVLDGASIHLPAVVLPNKVKAFECNRYPYLFESKGYALGWYPEQIDDLKLHTHTVEEIFQDIYTYGRKAQIGKKCYDYYVKSHSDNLALFIKAITASTLDYKKYLAFRKQTPNLKKLKWIIVDRIHKLHGHTVKRFSLLGVPILTVAKTNEYHANIYICCIPFLRINRIGATTSVHFLPVVWAYRVITKAFSLIRKVFKSGNMLEVSK